MARLLYGATAADVTVTQTGQIIPGAVLEAWSAESGGTRVTDLLDASGTPTTVVTSDAYGVVRFWCPDGWASTVWLQGAWGAGRMACKPANVAAAMSGGTALIKGDLEVSKLPGANVTLYLASGDAGRNVTVQWESAQSRRWAAGKNSTDDFQLSRFSDVGAFLSVPLYVAQATGRITFGDVGASAGVEMGTSGPRLMAGTGSPEGVVSAPVGSLWLRSDGGASTTLYVKQSGTGNTGWAAK